ncbi:unnamed protein product [Schistosoma spindalis]|nr:unnamed protein product [Schistosoma spindale]
MKWDKSSMCIYKFSCSCGDSYVGRTTRQLSQRMSEHLPTWFINGQIKTVRSSILAHLIDSGHAVDKSKSFRMIYRVPPSFPNGVRSRLLHIAEAIGIRTCSKMGESVHITPIYVYRRNL